MSGAWTPGPWRAVSRGDGTADIYACPTGKDFIEGEDISAPLHGRGMHMIENARLIAAAPDLAEALEFYANPEVYKPSPHGLAFDRRDLSYVARAALAKAKGEAA